MIEPKRNSSYLNRANSAKIDLQSRYALGERDFRGVKLSYANLSSIDLSGADLREADLSNADLSGAVLECVNLEGAFLNHAKLINANLKRASLSYTRLGGANLQGADLSNANLEHTLLDGALLSAVNLSNAYMVKAHLHKAYLKRANLRGANLSRAELSSADLSSADLTSAKLRDTTLFDTKLFCANLSNADFRDEQYQTWLGGTDLRNADLSNANLTGIDLAEANLEGAKLDGAILGRGETPNLSKAIKQDVTEISQSSNDLFKQQFPAGLPFGIKKPRFGVIPEKGSQKVHFEDEFHTGVIRENVYPNLSYQDLIEGLKGTPIVSYNLKESLINMSQTESEKQFFRFYTANYNMWTREIPVLIPQAWIQWHSDTKNELRNRNSSYAANLYRVDFVAFWKNKRFAILIDDISHYARKNFSSWNADEEKYSMRLKEDRKLRKEGWEVFRISNWEIRDEQVISEILADFLEYIDF